MLILSEIVRFCQFFVVCKALDRRNSTAISRESNTADREKPVKDDR